MAPARGWRERREREDDDRDGGVGRLGGWEAPQRCFWRIAMFSTMRVRQGEIDPISDMVRGTLIGNAL